jgi:hypothetical protein
MMGQIVTLPWLAKLSQPFSGATSFNSYLSVLSAQRFMPA